MTKKTKPMHNYDLYVTLPDESNDLYFFADLPSDSKLLDEMDERQVNDLAVYQLVRVVKRGTALVDIPVD